MEPPNTWKSEYLFLGRYTVELFTHFKARPISQTSRFDIPIDPELTRSHGFELQSETKTIINNQGNWGNVSLVAVVGIRKGFYFKSLNLKN